MLPRQSRPVGAATRGTTNPNRLRRMDRWITATHAVALRRTTAPIAVDLGYGAAPWTAVELLARLRAIRPDAEVVGVEIDPERVAAAAPYAREGLAFVHGGFEIPLPRRSGGSGGSGGSGASPAPAGPGGPGESGGPAAFPGPRKPGAAPEERRPVLIRAANVLRQYDEAEVAAVWARLRARLAPDGLLVEGTCDEIGRRHVWVAIGPEGPRTVTFAARLGSLERPSDLAERLPKALIHRNVPGEPVHAFLTEFDRAWAAAAPFSSLGARQRWMRAVGALRSAGWPVTGGPARWRQGEVTVAWNALAPARV